MVISRKWKVKRCWSIAKKEWCKDCKWAGRQADVRLRLVKQDPKIKHD